MTERPVAVALALALLVAVGPSTASANSTKQIKVVLEVRQSESQSQDAFQGRGGVIITERGTARSSGRLGIQSGERRATRTTGVFTIVQDGGESTLLVARQVPYPQVTYYRDYLTGAGYVATGVAFTDVGTSLTVRAALLPRNQVRVRLTPTISWFAHEQSGVTKVTEATTELIVPTGRPVVIGGTTARLHEITRHILGFAASQREGETLMILEVFVLE